MIIGNTYVLRGSTPTTPLLDDSGNRVNPDPTLITFRSVNFTGNPDAIVDLPTNSRRPIGSLTQRGFAVRVVHVRGDHRKPDLDRRADAGRDVNQSRNRTAGRRTWR